MGTYAKLKLPLLALLFLSMGCTQSFEGLSNKTLKPVENIKLETKPDGTGSELSSTQILLNDSLTFYPIKRDEEGNFVDNISVSWAVDGGIGALTIDPSGKFATFSGSNKGTATVKIYIDDVLYSTTSIDVVATQLDLSNFQISNVTTTSFDVSVDYIGDDEENSAVSLKYCNETQNPGCDPEAGTEVVLNRGASSWTGSVSSLNVAEIYNLTILAEDPDGVLGLPLTDQQRLLGNAISISNLVLSNITTSSFDVSVDFTGDSEANSELTVYYCNRTSSAACDPASGDSLAMTRGASSFTASVTGLSGPSYNAGDLVAIEVVADDFDGVSGSPLTASDNLADLRLSNFDVTNEVKDGFYAKVDFEEAVGSNATATLYYCNETDSPGCDPLSGTSASMTKNGSIFEVTVTGLSSPFDEGDQVNAVAVGSDPEGVLNEEALTETFYLADITLFELEYGYITTDGFVIEIKNGYGDSNDNSTVTAYYCNETTSPGCDPKTGVSEVICTESCKYVHEFTGVSSTVNPGETLKLLVEFIDPDGIYKEGTGGGSPAQYTLNVNIPNPKDIYRSVGPGQTVALIDGVSASTTLTISSGAAVFSQNLLDEIGVGDAIFYDSNADGNIDSLGFIHLRADNQNYAIRDKDGGTPANVAAHSDWKLYRAYVSAADAESGSENPGIVADSDIPIGLKNFDSWTDGLDISAQTGLDLNWYVALYAGTQADTSRLSVLGWKKDFQQELEFFVPFRSTEVGVSQKHNGTWDSSKYRLVVSDDDAVYIAWIQRVNIKGLQIELTGSTDSKAGINSNNNPLGFISDNIIKSTSTGNTLQGLRQYSYSGASSDSNYYFEDKSWSVFSNNIIYDFSTSNSRAIHVDWQSGNGDGARFYNNTLYNNYYGIYSDSYRSSYIRNNIVMASGFADFNSDVESSSVAYAENNITSDTTILDYNAYSTANNITNADPADVFFDHANDDFRLKSGSIAIGQGYDLSSIVFTDIQGETRTVPFDIGADEF